MNQTTSEYCHNCARPYRPEPVDFRLCCICERDLIATRACGTNWAKEAKEVPALIGVLVEYVELEEKAAPYSSSPMRERARAILARIGDAAC